MGAKKATTKAAGPGWTAHTISEYDPEQKPMGTGEYETRGDGKFIVLITSYRVRLLDKDNLYGGAKYHIDALRRSGIIPEDNPETIELYMDQVRVRKKALERSETVVYQVERNLSISQIIRKALDE